MSGDLGDSPASWKLPEGVDSALWQYSRSGRLADSEDDYFANHPLFEADSRLLRERFVEPGPLIDLGCGAGRLSVEFARRGFSVTSVDLSQPMLRKVAAKADHESLPIQTVRANLCRLGCFPDGVFSYALAMFSTFGMIRGRESRRKGISEAGRILRPGGTLALHAHNIWLNLHDSQGRVWLREQLWKRLRRQEGVGDRTMTYRGIPTMTVHLYRWAELRADLSLAGFRIDRVHSLDAISAKTIRWPRLCPGYRAGGWIVFASKQHERTVQPVRNEKDRLKSSSQSFSNY